MTQLLKVEKLHLQFGNEIEKDTLSQISFQLDQGESLLLLGASGSGKSTLTFCLNGLYPRELDGEMQGDVFINGKKATDYQPGELSRHVGIVFQDPETQFCMLTVEDEVAFGLENIGVPHEQMENKVDEALALVGMQDYKKASLTKLSGGQKQKLALACILALEPQLLILDEPTANLDPVAAKDLIETIQTLKQKINCSLIIIEHQLDGWTNITERCLLLNRQGEVFFDGSLRHAIVEKRSLLEKEGIWLPKVTQYLMKQPDTPVREDIPLTVDEFSEQTFRWTHALAEQINQQDLTTAHKLISVDNIHWKVGAQTIIQDVSLLLSEGEFVAITGANGSGKTSLSRIIAGLQRPTSGTISVKGRPLSAWNEADLREEIGYVFQNPEHQFITHTVFDEVAYSLRVKELPEKEIREKVKHILTVCDLDHLEYEHPFTLSQGQKRRLSVATMIVDDQQMLLLDEPTFGQDAHSNDELMSLLQQRYECGTTIVMITHDMELVHNYATRVIVVESGKIAADCRPDELWASMSKQLSKWQLSLPVSIQLKQTMERNLTHVSS